jgi:hypothetical protein
MFRKAPEISMKFEKPFMNIGKTAPSKRAKDTNLLSDGSGIGKPE